MTRPSRKLHWYDIFLILCAMVVLVIIMGFMLPGIQTGSAVALFVVSPTSTYMPYDPSSLTTASKTPFQPLPTDTPTATPTNTATPLPTATNTSTPVPTNTPVPQKPAIPPVDGLPASALITNITGYAQTHNLSCEARSAVDWARYFNVSISESDFLDHLPYTDNPETGFVGNVDDPYGNIPPGSYGVHAEPVAQVLRDYGLSAEAHKWYTFENLRQQIADGNPVIVWVIGNVWSGAPISYTPPDSDPIIVAHYEHTVIVIGYDEYGVTLLDNYYTYWRSTSEFLNSWSVLNYMAITSE